MKRPSPFLNTYIALAVLLGLGAYVYFVDSKKEDDGSGKEKVFSFEKAKVKEVTLAPAEGETIHLARDGSSWRLIGPQPVPADDGEVESILSTLESLEVDSVAVDKAPALADFGLASPKTTVSVVLEGASEPVKLLLGDKAPDGTSLYAKLPGQERVFTVPSYAASSLEKKPFDLRDRSVLHVKREDVKTLEIAGPEGAYALARSGDEWAFTRPLATRAGRWSVDGLVGTLESLRMEKVAAEDAKDLGAFGLERPARTVTLGLADGSSRTLEIGSPAGEKQYHAREAGRRLVAVIPGAVVDDLAKGMGELRAKRLLDVATYDVEGFDVESGGTKRTCARSASKGKDGFDTYSWKRTAPDAKDLETNTVQDALFKIGGTEAVEFVDAPGPPADHGLETPRLKVTLRFAAGEPPATPKPPAWFELGEKGGKWWARRPDDTALLVLDAAKAEELVKAFEEL